MENRKIKLSKYVCMHTVYICIIVIIIAVFTICFVTSLMEQGTISNGFAEIANNSMTIVVSIAASILSSVMYTFIMQKRSEEEKEELKEDIEKSVETVYDKKKTDQIEQISKRVSEIFSETSDMMPSKCFRSANSPNLEFNLYLNKKITESRKFVYYGESPRFTCKRLYKLKDETENVKNLKIDIYVIDPTDDEMFKNNKAFLEVKEKNRFDKKARDFNTIVLDEKTKIMGCLYALGEMSGSFYELNVYLIKDIPFIDIEMTDDMIALEFFRTRNDYKRYPLTIIYDNKDAYYESYEFYLDWESKKATRISGEELTVDYILKIGEKAGLPNLTKEQLKDYCDMEIFEESEKYI